MVTPFADELMAFFDRISLCLITSDVVVFVVFVYNGSVSVPLFCIILNALNRILFGFVRG